MIPQKQKKCEKWKEVTELSDSRGCPWQYFCSTPWQGVDPVFGVFKLIQFLGPSVRKRIKIINAELSMQLNSYLE